MIRRIVLLLCAALTMSACATQPPLPTPSVPEVEQPTVSTPEAPSKPEPTVVIEPTATPLAAAPMLVMASETAQGETLLLRVTNAKEQTLSIKTELSFQPTFFTVGDDQIALLPVHYDTAPGQYQVTVTGEGSTYRKQVLVTKTEFDIQRMTIDQSTVNDTALSSTANDEWTRRVEPLKSISDPAQYWEGAFALPIESEITTQFASIRYTNNDPTPSRHNGIDFDANTGDPVLASNNGRILFADFLQLTGNTVIIEHGCGLKSLYYHMNSLNVKEGDMVKKGDPLGGAGSTGYSTGPHIHFAMAVNNVFVDPWQMVNSGL